MRKKSESEKVGTLTRREQVAKLAARSLMEVIWAAATRRELAAMLDAPALDLGGIGEVGGVMRGLGSERQNDIVVF